MQLGDILDDLTLDAVTGSVEIHDVQIDSRECGPGSLFFALPGATKNGRDFALEAVERGSTCVVAGESFNLDVPLVVVPPTQLRALCAHASATVTGHPETKAQLVAVTGTNGKTSVTSFIAQIARQLNWNGANIGTLTNERTTPASPELFRTLAGLVGQFDSSLRHSVVALEVSSHAIDQQRIEGLRFAVAAFTNLGHDHLDYHVSMEEYFAVKSRLFTAEHAQRAVIWTDDVYGERLAAATALPVTAVSRRDASDVVATIDGTSFRWRGDPVTSPLVGDYNVDNALIALTILAELGANVAALASAMSAVHSIPGRFDVLRGARATVVVDYAHTPEGLRRLLDDVRALAPGRRIVTVFGCGGDRDRSKRPEMGRVASSLSDITIVTTDNPRSESPDVIMDAIMSGVIDGATVHRTEDRRAAIAQAIDDVGPGDVVVLAGKGHETTQTSRGVVVPFDDRAVALELLK